MLYSPATHHQRRLRNHQRRLRNSKQLVDCVWTDRSEVLPDFQHVIMLLLAQILRALLAGPRSSGATHEMDLRLEHRQQLTAHHEHLAGSSSNPRPLLLRRGLRVL